MTTDSLGPVESDEPAPVEPTSPTLDAASVLGRNKHILLSALRQAGITQVTVTYAGTGDSGSVYGVEAEMPEGTHFDAMAPVPLYANQAICSDGAWQTIEVEQSTSVEQALRDFADDIVDWLHGSWEDGASGSVVFDCAADSVRVEHNAYFTDSDYTETVLCWSRPRQRRRTACLSTCRWPVGQACGMSRQRSTCPKRSASPCSASCRQRMCSWCLRASVC